MQHCTFGIMKEPQRPKRKKKKKPAMSEHNAFQIQSCRIKERYSRWSCTQKRRSNQSTASPFRWSCNTLLRFGAYLNTSSGCHGAAGGGGGGRRVGPRPAGWLAGRWPVKRWDDGGMCLELRGALFCARGERPCPSLICSSGWQISVHHSGTRECLCNFELWCLLLIISHTVY